MLLFLSMHFKFTQTILNINVWMLISAFFLLPIVAPKDLRLFFICSLIKSYIFSVIHHKNSTSFRPSLFSKGEGYIFKYSDSPANLLMICQLVNLSQPKSQRSSEPEYS